MLASHMLMLSLPDLGGDYAPWLVAAAVIVLGLFVYGLKDLLRFSARRVWAISSVCFAEAIRKRILWVTPLAIIGVIIVSQLSSPGDPQDAIRQATKFCLFASGLLVTIVAVILACTNLPREIDNRVIYTVVTKPTTRLEIVLGKVLGFARVSAAILIIMGIFTYAYLKTRTWTEMAQVRRQLATLPPDSTLRPTLAYYANSGFLSTKSLDAASDFQIFGRPPQGNINWMQGGEGEYFIVPFALNDEQKATLTQVADANGAAFVMTTLHIEQHKPNADEKKLIREMGLDKPLSEPAVLPAAPLGPDLPMPQPTTAPTTKPVDEDAPPPVQVRVSLLNEFRRPLSGASPEAEAGRSVTLEKPSKPEDSWYGRMDITADAIQSLVTAGRFNIRVTGHSPATDFGAESLPVMIYIPTADGKGIKITPAPDPNNGGKPAAPEFLSFPGRHGMQLHGQSDGSGPIAVYRFTNASVSRTANDKAALQLQLYVEKNGEFQTDTEGEAYARASVEVINRKTGKSSGQLIVTPELSRTLFVDVPYNSVDGGDFDVLVRGLTKGQWLGMRDTSVALVTADQSFLVNLFKSLLLLWLLSILVVIIAVFCSTFLSWPIAVVCTLVILLGHWGVVQLGDALKPGIGHSTATEFKIYDPGAARVWSQTVEGLSSGLRFVSQFLPDVSRFPVTEYIERGVSVPLGSMLGALAVLLCYGLPLLVISYVILRKKEVAP